VFHFKESSHDDKYLLETKKLILLEGDGRKGLKEFGPYDAIHVGAGK
jgi:protein-L-isoaspartate(D-aspartate) O-methyltransferase